MKTSYKIIVRIAILTACIALVGCNTTDATITSADGKTIQHIRNTRAAWSSESYSWSFSTNGTWSAAATKSGPDAATVQAILGIVQTLTAVKP